MWKKDVVVLYMVVDEDNEVSDIEMEWKKWKKELHAYVVKRNGKERENIGSSVSSDEFNRSNRWSFVCFYFSTFLLSRWFILSQPK